MRSGLADAGGYYISTGNGGFDGTANYSDSLLLAIRLTVRLFHPVQSADPRHG
jgi:hypothetical protein